MIRKNILRTDIMFLPRHTCTIMSLANRQAHERLLWSSSIGWKHASEALDDSDDSRLLESTWPGFVANWWCFLSFESTQHCHRLREHHNMQRLDPCAGHHWLPASSCRHIAGCWQLSPAQSYWWDYRCWYIALFWQFPGRFWPVLPDRTDKRDDANTLREVDLFSSLIWQLAFLGA